MAPPHETDVSVSSNGIGTLPIAEKEYKVEIRWRNVVLMGLLHLSIPYSLYLSIYHVQYRTLFWAWLLHIFGGLGITVGAHRLWTHKSYKAKFPLRLFLAFLNTIALQNSIYEWSRDHRVHHKFSETDADPHNAKRGFFFSHMGWLLCRKHPDVKRRGKVVDCSDLLLDPVVRFQKDHYLKLVLCCWLLFPIVIPHLLWREPLVNCVFVCVYLRYLTTLHSTWLVNSAAHMWGNQPYDRHIQPAENIAVTILAGGEGFHNYHHTFPWDYATSEHGCRFNMSSAFIDAFASVGLAYDRKVAPPRVVADRKCRTGDSTWSFNVFSYRWRH